MKATRRRTLAVLFAVVAAAAIACGGPASPRPTPGALISSASRPSPPAAPRPQKVEDLGTLTLESGETIEALKVGYRTFGTYDPVRGNAVLFPTWFTGTTEDLVSLVPDELVDTSRFFLVLVDALGNGVSSSPSTDPLRPRLRFPRFSVRDMVEAERLLLDRLGIGKLHAVGGISMGGMQAFEWAASHPERVGRVFSIVGSPKMASSDLLLWNAELAALVNDRAYEDGEYRGHPLLRAVVDIHHFALFTPALRTRETAPEAFAAYREQIAKEARFDWNDWRRQLEAMIGHDVGRGRGGLEGAARRITARSLVIVAEQDHMVSPVPARAFASLLGSDVVTLVGDCGHASPRCEPETVKRAVRALLAR